MHDTSQVSNRISGVVLALGEAPMFGPGDHIKIASRFPVGHYRVPVYIRGKTGLVQAVIEPPGLNNEEEGYGRNAGGKLYYYRVSIPMTELWPQYIGSLRDTLYVEVFETWMERI